MTNVVLDAGTDARVAKFLKRGLEVIGLAVLDPMEVWNHGKIGSGPLLSTEHAVAGSARNSFDHHRLSVPAPQTPDSSVVSFGSTGDPTPKTRDLTPATAASTPQNTPTGARKFFGKLFRRKDAPIPGVVEPSDSPVSSPMNASLNLPTPSSPAKRNSLLQPDQALSPFLSKDVVLQPAVLGIQPTLNATSYPPHGRPTAYVWTVTKWLKGSPEGLLGNVKGMFQGDKSIRDEPMGELERQVEVRFEWTRMDRGGKKKTRRTGTDVTVGLGVEGGSRSASRRNSAALTDSNNPSVNSLNEKDKRAKRSSIIEGVQSRFGLIPKRSMESARSRSPKRPGSVITNTTTSETAEGDDEAARSRETHDGEESDPEDSEVPWTCTLHVVRKLTGAPLSPTTNTPSGSRFSQRSGQQRSPDASGPQTPGPTTAQRQQQALGIQSIQSQTTIQGPPPPQKIKLKVATVSPTPHHPKVVSLLKIPFPLPDIEVSSVNVRKRVVTPVGIARPADAHSSPVGNGMGNLNMQSFSLNGNGGKPRDTGLVLTAEEIKDIVASTALWLVVREAMGGVGKDRRKGDGWKLRG